MSPGVLGGGHWVIFSGYPPTLLGHDSRVRVLYTSHQGGYPRSWNTILLYPRKGSILPAALYTCIDTQTSDSISASAVALPPMAGWCPKPYSVPSYSFKFKCRTVEAWNTGTAGGQLLRRWGKLSHSRGGQTDFKICRIRLLELYQEWMKMWVRRWILPPCNCLMGRRYLASEGRRLADRSPSLLIFGYLFGFLWISLWKNTHHYKICFSSQVQLAAGRGATKWFVTSFL